MVLGVILILGGALFLSLGRNGDQAGAAWNPVFAQQAECVQGKYADGCQKYAAAIDPGFYGEGGQVVETAEGAGYREGTESVRGALSPSTSLAYAGAAPGAASLPSGRYSYLYAGKKLARFDGSAIEYFHSDHLGTAMARTGPSAAVVEESRLLSHGVPLSAISRETDFTGKKVESGTGLEYFGARYYHPAVGRFIGPDPRISEEMELYSYVENNPLLFTDPDGEAKVVYYRGVDEISSAITPSNPSAGITVTEHVNSGSKNSQFLSLTTEKSVADRFGPKMAAVSPQQLEGEILSTDEVVRRIKHEIASGKATRREGEKAIRLARKNAEVLLVPTKRAHIATIKLGGLRNARLGVAGASLGVYFAGQNVAHAAEEGGAEAASHQAVIEGSATLGALEGGLMGAKAGFALGSFLGPVGQVVGSCAGGIAGACLGDRIMRAGMEAAFRDEYVYPATDYSAPGWDFSRGNGLLIPRYTAASESTRPP